MCRHLSVLLGIPILIIYGANVYSATLRKALTPFLYIVPYK